MTEVQTLHVSEALNNGLKFKFYVPAHELPGIENYVSSYINANVGETIIHGQLNRVSTWTKKEKGEIIGIYKCIDMTVVRIEQSTDEVSMELQLCDSKAAFDVPVSVTLNVI